MKTMKYPKYIIGLVSILLFTSCQKNEVLNPKFDVSTEIPFWSGNNSVKVNTSVKFLIDGNADFITFYSGELGREYQFRDRTTLPSGVAIARDKGLAIKGFSENTLTNFNHLYVAAGNFTATFVATNHTKYGEEKSVVINIPVIVIPK